MSRKHRVKKSNHALSSPALRGASGLTRAAFATVEALEQRRLLTAAIGSSFTNDYTLFNLGAVPGVSTNYGGLVVNPSNTNQLLIGGSANASDGTIQAIDVTRDMNGHITGFTGESTLYASAPYIDGGLQFGPGGDLFFTEYPENELGEIKPGDTSPDKTVDLTSDDGGETVGSLGFVPSGFANAGHMKILSYEGDTETDATLSPDGSGTYNITPGASVSAGYGPEGVAFVLGGNGDFSSNSALLSNYSGGEVDAYSLDGNSNVTGSATPFVTGLTGAEGATVDPVTGDFLFSTYGGGSAVYEVQGFTDLPTAPGAATTTTAVSSSLNPSNFGQSVTFTASVTPSSGSFDDGGTVQFLIDGSDYGSAVTPSGGVATISDSSLGVSGSPHTVTADYSGDTSFGSSNGTLSGGETVNQATTTTSLSSTVNPSAYGESVTFSATVNPGTGTFDNGGVVQFVIDGTDYGTPVTLSGGVATVTDSSLTISGSPHTVTADYSGDSNFQGSNGTLTGGQTINKATTSVYVSSSIDPSAYGQVVTFTATVTPTYGSFDNGGTVQFSINNTNYGPAVPVSGGIAIFTYSAVSVTGQTYSVKAVYSGDSNFLPSSGSLTGGQIIDKATPTVNVIDAGGVVNGYPYPATGSVVGVNGANLGTPTFKYYLASDTTFSHPLAGAPSAVGSYVVVGSYAGNTNYAAATNKTSFSINPITTIVTVSDPGGVYDGYAYYANGSVTLSNGTYVGVPTFTYYLASDTSFSNPLPGAPSAVGNYVVVATYKGAGNTVIASAKASFSITPKMGRP